MSSRQHDWRRRLSERVAEEWGPDRVEPNAVTIASASGALERLDDLWPEAFRPLDTGQDEEVAP